LAVNPAELLGRSARAGESEVELPVRVGSREVNYAIWSEASDEEIMIDFDWNRNELIWPKPKVTSIWQVSCSRDILECSAI
jgi:hypothetical protein